MIFNPLNNPANRSLTDLNRRELGLMLPLVVVIIWLGVYPAPVLNRMETAVQTFVERVEMRGTTVEGVR
jgi:NADH-quinone oxidoreductase subunit M